MQNKFSNKNQLDVTECFIGYDCSRDSKQLHVFPSILLIYITPRNCIVAVCYGLHVLQT